ncbi:LysR family transcriptional regulator [Burkholderia cenocepacia]|uniref:LysR family transcriptional regulator n=1 Tax=Burkholderia cenocepacia TaxID=95486 RepID=UPI00223185C8|nr:LysR family transcriptional regulator [Burkholderia cenocepacia]MCW3662555.1 LysR family transcriptional regulator [Burkholderia cenocepacia]
MDLRHLRCFLVLAEELHFSRAAERLHMEQSPLSRIIKDLEEELGTALFDRNRRGTRLTISGQIFFTDISRLFAVLEQAKENLKAVSEGARGILRVASSDGTIEPRLSTWLARCREEEPEIEVRLFEVPLSEQLRGLHEGIFDAGFARTDYAGSGIIAKPIWQDKLMVAVPARHPVLAHPQVSLNELARYPIVTGDPKICEGYCKQITRLFHSMDLEPSAVEHVTSLDMMLTLVGAGYGLGFVTAGQISVCRRSDVVIRPILEDGRAVLKTYLLYLGKNKPPQLHRIADRFGETTHRK